LGDEGVQLRLRGKMQKLDDDELKKNIIDNRFVFLKEIADQYGLGVFALLRLSSGSGRIWAARHPADNTEPFEF